VSSRRIVYRVSPSERHGNGIQTALLRPAEPTKKPATSTACPHRQTAGEPHATPIQADGGEPQQRVRDFQRPPRSPPPHSADRSSVFVTAFVTTMTGQCSHAPRILTVSGTVFLPCRCHTRARHVRAFCGSIRHRALLLRVEPVEPPISRSAPDFTPAHSVLAARRFHSHPSGPL
jgi:hypothetical protein